ncbi:PAS domain-containing sensor histidine kinase [Nafulsella turpanensis]|uniref:PAS domain-containing sensor histidine kinase n=1 Tax=Nafulsella turpanensis TaxID=1265690 RepID=UPI00034989DD|nr:PAS domain-containing sensor histidine kinase [Nafulsella turpanensis]
MKKGYDEQSEEILKNKQENISLERMMHFSPDMICLFDREGYFLKVSGACENILGYSTHDLEGRKLDDFVHPDDLEKTMQEAGRSVREGKSVNFENRYVDRSGREVYLQWSGGWSGEEQAFFYIGRDITEHIVVRKKLRQQEELYSSLVENGADMLALLDKELNVVYSGGSTLKILGHAPKYLEGKSALDFIHPDDIPLIETALSSALVSEGEVKVSDFRFRDAGGNWRWLETSVNNQLANPNIGAFVTSSRDITDRILIRQGLEESRQRFKALFEANPDIVVFESREGIILDVNPTASFYFRTPREDAISRPLSDFLPVDAKQICQESLQQALKGEQPNFELEVILSRLGKKVLDVTKIPVMVDQEVVGVYTIARDVTAVKTSGDLIKQQASKLSTIFESITDAFFTLDKDWNLTYVNSEFERLTLLSKEACIGKDIWSIFPEESGGEFYRQYHKAVETGKSVHFEAFLARVDKWLQVKAYPSTEGLSVYFDDVTETVNSKQELEKLSLVASKTTNGVMILDADGVTEWVNEGFTDITGYSLSEAIGKQLKELLQGEETDLATLKRINEKRIQGKPFSEEMLTYKKSGEKVWLFLDITPVFDDFGKIVRFINIQTDITYRKQAEEAQQQLTRDLFLQNRDLQQFTYMVSHNLRSPLANAMGLVNLLKEVDKDSEVFDTSLAYLKESVFKLDNVLKDMNTILSIRDRKDNFENEWIPLAQLCRESLHDLEEPLEKSGGVVNISIHEQVKVQGNKAYLYSIFHNLLSNAIKYRWASRPLKVNITCLAHTTRGTIISFTDNGSGIDLSKAGDNLFKLYKRFHNHSDGRGIGLYLIKTHMEAMGGYIEINSEPKVGTRFLLYFK